MSRFTVKQLEETIAKINGWLKEAGATKRFIVGGRNGYQAVDEYTVKDDVRVGSGVNGNVGCGTSRECSQHAHDHYNMIVRQMDRDKIADLEKENKELKSGIIS